MLRPIHLFRREKNHGKEKSRAQTSMAAVPRSGGGGQGINSRNSRSGGGSKRPGDGGETCLAHSLASLSFFSVIFFFGGGGGESFVAWAWQRRGISPSPFF